MTTAGPCRVRARGLTGPVHRTGLLFHHPPAAPANCTIKIVVKGLKIRITLPGKAALMVRIRANAVFEKAQRVTVPTGKIQIFANLEMVKIGDPAHVVMGDRCIRMGPNDLNLRAVECHNLIRGKTAEGQRMGGVRFRHRKVGQVDLVKIIVFHRPEHIAPRGIQRRNIPVISSAGIAGAQPSAKGVAGRNAVGDGGVVAAIFIIGLPCRHMRIPAIAFGQCGDDAAAFGKITRMGKAIVPPRSKSARATFGIEGQHIGMFVHKPTRRCRGGRAQHDLEACRAQYLNRAIKPAKGVFTRRRLQPRPCKFTDAHPGQPGLGHPAGILDPDLFGPVFGVITGAEAAFQIGHRIT